MVDRETAHNNSPDVRHSFVVRIWREGNRSDWRGWVLHARSGESSYVQDTEGPLGFIERRTGKLTGAVGRGLRLRAQRMTRRWLCQMDRASCSGQLDSSTTQT